MKKIKFIHMSDSHIGLNRYSRTTDKGHNLRGEDFLESFRQLINGAIQLEPDLILHSGDLFENVTIADRYIYEVQKILQNVSCPFIVIAGNHDNPKSLSAINPILLLETVNNVEIVNKDYQIIELNIRDINVSIHAIPHMNNYEEFSNTLSSTKLEESADFNIAMTHGALPFGSYVCMEEGHMIPQSFINKKFDYIALGDYHISKKIHDRCYYSGGTDIFKSSEISDKGLLEIQLENNEIKVAKHSINVRHCCKINIDCQGKNLEDIYLSIENSIKDHKITDSVVFLDLCDIDSSVREILDRLHIKSLFKGCFYVQEKVSTKKIGQDSKCINNEVIGDLLTEWKDFSKDNDVQSKLGESYINVVIEGNK